MFAQQNPTPSKDVLQVAKEIGRNFSPQDGFYGSTWRKENPDTIEITVADPNSPIVDKIREFAKPFQVAAVSGGPAAFAACDE